VGQLQEELHQLYVPAYYRSLTVTVKLQERYFFVGGQVRSPGMKPYLQQMDVISAIQAGGDFTDFADRRNIKIVRSDGRTEEVSWKVAVKDPKANRPIYPGDRVIVAQRILW
jgi:protein involved in polysaccharide export with SLBB domain